MMVNSVKKYKINLADYVAEDGAPKPGVKEEKYNVRRVMVGIMLHPAQQYKGFRFHTVSKTAARIKNCKEDFIILDPVDYEILKVAFDNFSGFGPADTELVSRVYEPEIIQN